LSLSASRHPARPAGPPGRPPMCGRSAGGSRSRSALARQDARMTQGEQRRSPISKLRTANVLEVRGEGATLRVPETNPF
jgi:hypothetical protein